MGAQEMDLIARAERGELGALNALIEVALEREDHELRVSAKRLLARIDERVFFNEVDESLLIEIPAGPSVLGWARKPEPKPTYYMAQHPVTNRQFARFVEQTGYAPQDDDMGVFLAHWPEGQPPQDKLDHPVVYVSMIDALHYCQWAGLMLPSEWMWEKAAAGPSGQTHPWGSAATNQRLATVCTDDTQHVEAHRKVRSVYGCQDMIGNVSEWCVMGFDEEIGFISPSPTAMLSVPPEALATMMMGVRGSAYLRQSPELMICQHQRQLSAGRRNQWVGFRTSALVLKETSLADKWGELRSICHEPELELPSRLSKLDYVLATWPRGQDAAHEVREYLRSHVNLWRPGQEEMPDPYAIFMWLNGLKAQVFEAFRDEGAPSPSYGLIQRCIQQMNALFEEHDGFIFGRVELAAQEELIMWLRERSSAQTGSSEPSSQEAIVSVNVTLPQLERAIPAIELEPSSGLLSFYTRRSARADSWDEWFYEEILMWLEAMVQLVKHHPKITIDLDLDIDAHALQELRALWSFYAQCRGV